MKLIDADSYQADYKHLEVKEVLQSMPEAVVRCKNCKFLFSFRCPMEPMKFADLDSNSFCSKGERREKDETQIEG